MALGECPALCAQVCVGGPAPSVRYAALQPQAPWLAGPCGPEYLGTEFHLLFLSGKGLPQMVLLSELKTWSYFGCILGLKKQVSC